jgi:hypothetical protein
LAVSSNPVPVQVAGWAHPLSPGVLEREERLILDTALYLAAHNDPRGIEKTIAYLDWIADSIYRHAGGPNGGHPRRPPDWARALGHESKSTEA